MNELWVLGSTCDTCKPAGPWFRDLQRRMGCNQCLTALPRACRKHGVDVCVSSIASQTALIQCLLPPDITIVRREFVTLFWDELSISAFRIGSVYDERNRRLDELATLISDRPIMVRGDDSRSNYCPQC